MISARKPGQARSNNRAPQHQNPPAGRAYLPVEGRAYLPVEMTGMRVLRRDRLGGLIHGYSQVA